VVSSPAMLKGASALETNLAILELIRSSGVVSRTELVDRSGLTGASITRIVRQLLDEGLVAETGLGESTGGKRRTLIQLNSSARIAVGISLDYDQIRYSVINLGGQVIAERSAKGTGAKAPYEVTQRIAVETAALLEAAGIDGSQVIGIGVAIAGRWGSRDQAHPSNANATDWELFALEETLGAASGKPVLVENDSTCAAIGEYWVGRLPSTENFATVYMTDGFGLGLVIKGSIYRGASANAGEIGHMTVDPSGPECVCGRRGCLHALGGVERIVGLARRDVKLVGDLRLRDTPRTVRADYVKIARAAAGGNDRASRLIHQSAGYLAGTLVSITNLLDLDQIILAGPGFALVGPIFARVAADQLRTFTWARSVHEVRVSLSRMGSDVAALGAASLVLHSQLTPRQASARVGAANR
jgi:predicted NBD/HSP70 family sugar kinase